MTPFDGAAFVANTDFGWLSHFLHRVEPPDEVDFWQLSPHGFKAIPPAQRSSSVSVRPTRPSPVMAASPAASACLGGSRGSPSAT